MSKFSQTEEPKTAGEINQNSTRVLYIEMYFNNTKLASGTAFFIKSEKGPVFITNRHNVTGRHQETEVTLDENLGACQLRCAC